MMRIGILCAGDRELAPFLEILEPERAEEQAMLMFYQGKIGSMDVVMLYSGVGKVNAAIAAQLLIEKYQVDGIVNAGTGGGMHPEVQIFDLVVAEECAYHDVAAHILTGFHPWMDSRWFSSDEKWLKSARAAAERFEGRIHFGRMVTGEQFIADAGRKAINEELAPLSVDMETAAIAHVCYAHRTPFLSVRCMTDDAAHTGSGYFEENCAKAAERAKDFVLALLEEMQNAPEESPADHLDSIFAAFL